MKRIFTAATLTVGLIASSANAAVITVDDTDTFLDGTRASATTHTVSAAELSGFNPTGSDKIVLVLSDESSQDITSVTYGGTAMTQGHYHQGGFFWVGIFYLDDPGSAGDLVVNYEGGVTGIGLSLMALSNTVDGIGAISPVSTDHTVSLTTAADSIVIAGSNLNNAGTLVAQAPLTPLLSNADTGSTTSASGYFNGTAAGPGTYEFTDSGARLTLAVEFLAVPEPGSLALLGLGGLCMMRRRRA